MLSILAFVRLVRQVREGSTVSILWQLKWFNTLIKVSAEKVITFQLIGWNTSFSKVALQTNGLPKYTDSFPTAELPVKPLFLRLLGSGREGAVNGEDPVQSNYISIIIYCASQSACGVTALIKLSLSFWRH